MACAWEGVQRSVGPNEFICDSSDEGETTCGGATVAPEVGGFNGCWAKAGGDGVPAWEAEGLGEGSSTFTVRMLPAVSVLYTTESQFRVCRGLGLTH